MPGQFLLEKVRDIAGLEQCAVHRAFDFRLETNLLMETDLEIGQQYELNFFFRVR